MTKIFHCFSFLLMRNVHKFYSSKYIIKKNTLLFVFILYLELFTQLSVYCHFIFSFNKECFYYIKLVNLLCLYSRKIVRNKNAELCQKVILIHSFIEREEACNKDIVKTLKQNIITRSFVRRCNYRLQEEKWLIEYHISLNTKTNCLLPLTVFSMQLQ